MNNAKTITNISGASLTIVDLLPAPSGSLARREFSIAAGATLDLSTIVSRDESSRCTSLDAAIAAAYVTVGTSYTAASQDAEIAALQTEVDGKAAKDDVPVSASSAATVVADAAVQTGAYVQVDVQSIADLANDLKAKYNVAVTLINELKTIIAAMNA